MPVFFDFASGLDSINESNTSDILNTVAENEQFYLRY